MAHRHISFHLQPRIARRRLGFTLLLFVGLGCASAARAQDDALSSSPMSDIETDGDAGLRAHVAALPSAPTPKVQPIAGSIIQPQSQTQLSGERTHRFYWLDRTSLTYGLVLSGAEMFDGVTTRYFIHH
jgi:hypothetical protein